MTDHTAEKDAPNGCGICGNDQRSHASRYHVSVGFHTYVEPTDEQRKRRMLVRRADCPIPPAEKGQADA